MKIAKTSTGVVLICLRNPWGQVKMLVPADCMTTSWKAMHALAYWQQQHIRFCCIWKPMCTISDDLCGVLANKMTHTSRVYKWILRRLSVHAGWMEWCMGRWWWCPLDRRSQTRAQFHQRSAAALCTYVIIFASSSFWHQYVKEVVIQIAKCYTEKHLLTALPTHVQTAEDGVFWMDISDFLRLFNRITYVHMLPGLYMQVARGKI